MPRAVTTTPGILPAEAAPRSTHCELTADTRSPGLLRNWVTALLAGWQLPHLIDDLTLIATELATNALRHGAAPARVGLALCEPEAGHRVVRLEIEDSGPGFDPEDHTSDPGDTSENCDGRGLLLVAALAGTWGAMRTSNGQLVWAELPA
ncbi:ATP-binding protein [Streptomyces sp. BE20]|uniref:ATP-binding protein n=1 Tax=Streptomyces sp. BE20 TaxID=3002525 RepID=UPI002E7794C0|nr:ATP-binding protein [Streptomyces sp. BE20]MEE1822162.1 ATP-binding protein [Streptomyces sp. BE20]